jgi:hypothetical protein
MHKSATKCNETIGKWCKNKHGASKIIDTLETYQVCVLFVFGCKFSRLGLIVPIGKWVNNIDNYDLVALFGYQFSIYVIKTLDLPFNNCTYQWKHCVALLNVLFGD